MNKIRKARLLLGCAWTGVSLAIAGQAVAQEAAERRDNTVEEVTVTAQKREQTLQDVPVSVGVVTEETIKELAITNLDELSAYVPGLVVSEGGEQTGISIRGFGAGLNFGFDQSVGLFVDEVYAGRERQFRGTFLDIERVEVLKGPQGTLFGKNTIAGAVTITSGTPTHDPFVSLRGEYSPDTNLRAVEAVVNGPIVEGVLAGRLAARWADEDGYMFNTLTRETEEQEEDKIVRGTLLWTPNDRLRVKLKGEWSEYDRIGRNFSISEISGFAVGRPMTTLNALPRPVPVDVDFPARLSIYQFFDPQFDVGLNFTTSKQQETAHVEYRGGVLDARYDLGFAELVSITGYNAYESNDQRDVDWSPVPYLFEPITQDFSQWSQEFRLVSDIGEHFDYIAGLYWFKSDFYVDRRTDVDIVPYLVNPVTGLYYNYPPINAFLPTPDPTIRYTNVRFLDQTAETYSAYIQATWHIIPDTLHLTGGLRWMRETKEASDRYDVARYGTVDFLDPVNRPADAVLLDRLRAVGLNQAILGQRHSFQGERTEEQVLPEVRISWDVNPDIMFYAGWSKGYKGGGFNSNSATQSEDDDFSFDPETAYGYEIGGKLRLFDRRVAANFALFRQDFEDLQVSIWQGNGFFLTNAGKARSQGLEGDFTWYVTDRFRLNGSFQLLDATYTASVLAACNIGQLNFGQPGCFQIPAPTAANPNATRPVQDWNGKRFSPRYNAVLGAQYIQPFNDDVEILWRADARFAAKGEFALDPTITQPAYQLLDLGATLRSTDPDRPWYVGVTVQNVFDKRRWYYEFEAPAQIGTRIGFPAPGRQATFRIGYEW